MKYSSLHQFFSVAMAIVVLFSTLSVSIGKHYCGDHLVDVALYSEAENCGMEMDDMTLDSHNEGHIVSKKMCCTDTVDLFEGQDELSVEKTQVLEAYQKAFILSFAVVFSGLNVLDTQKDPASDHYSPPTYTRDIQVLNQVFLI